MSVQAFWYRAGDTKALGIIIKSKSNVFKPRLSLWQEVKQSQHTAHSEVPGTTGPELIFCSILHWVWTVLSQTKPES